MAELSVELRASIKKFAKDLKTAEKSVEQFGKTSDKVTGKAKQSDKNLEGLGEAFAMSAIGATTLVAGLVLVSSELIRVATQSTSAELAQQSLALAMGKATASTSAEITKLGVLSDIAQNETLSRERRNRAVDELQRKYPKYLSNINLENIATKETKDQLDLLSNALVRNSRIKAISGQIAKQQTIIYQEEAKSWWDRFDAADAFFEVLKSGGATGTGVLGLFKSLTKDSTNAQITVAALNKELKKLLLLENAAGFGSGGAPGAVRGPDQRESSILTAGFIIPALDLELVPPEAVPNFADSLTELERVWLDFSNRMEPLINRGIADTFGNIGSAIGSAIANGTSIVDAAGSALLSSIGSMMVQLGKQAIAVGVGLEAIKVAFETLGGFGAIAAGVALVALGSAFVSTSKGLGQNFGSGGYSASGGGGSGGFSTNSSFSGASSAGYGEVVFRIGGQELIGVLSRVSNKNQRFGLNG